MKDLTLRQAEILQLIRDTIAARWNKEGLRPLVNPPSQGVANPETESIR